MDEITEVMSLKRLGLLGRANKPVMIYNVNGYYDKLFGFLDDMTREGFWRPEDRANVIEVKRIEDIAEALENAGNEDTTRNTLYDDHIG
jgi:predicted Rossmann-fold nucleotide-binding protein